MRITREFECGSVTISEGSEAYRPIPSWLFPHHHLSPNQDVLLVIHDLRKGKLDVRRVHNVDREMFGSNTDSLLTCQMRSSGWVQRRVPSKCYRSSQVLLQRAQARVQERARPVLQIVLKVEILPKSCGKTRCRLCNPCERGPNLRDSFRELSWHRFHRSANQRSPDIKRRNLKRGNTTNGNLVSASGIP